MSLRSFVPAFILFCCAGSLLAGEGIKYAGTGSTLLHKKYTNESGDAYTPSDIQIDINVRVSTPGGWTTLSSTHSEIVKLVSNTAFALGLWENVPGSRLNFGLGFYRTISSIDANDDKNVFTLSEMDGDGAANLKVDDATGALLLEEFDVYILRSWNNDEPTIARGILVQETGHGVGFNHSWLNSSAMLNVTGAGGLGSFMSYSGLGGLQDTANQGMQPEDAALASRLYPNLFACQSLTTGTIRGCSVDAAAAKDLFGANVLLINSSGQAVSSRISGYANSDPNGTKYGIFDLVGVAPGTYDVLVMAMDDPDAILGNPNPEIINIPAPGGDMDATVNFNKGFPKAFVRNVTVAAGEIVDLGLVVAGTDRSFDNPTRMEVTARYTGAGSYSAYWFDFWSTNPWQMSIRSGAQSNPWFAARVLNQSHLVKMLGWNGSGWVVLQDWTSTDYRGRKASVTWSRATHMVTGPSGGSQSAEALRYRLGLQQSPSTDWSYAFIHGNKYTAQMIPGTHVYFVEARWTMSESYFVKKFNTAFSVQP